MQTIESMTEHLQQILGAPVTIVLGRSRTKPVQARSLRGGVFAKVGVELRLHQVFLKAPQSVVADLGQWLKVGGRAQAASRRLDEWIHTTLDALPPKAERRVWLRPNGLTYDLEPLRNQVIEHEFDGAFPAPPPPGSTLDSIPVPSITWGKRGTPRKGYKRTRTMRLGSYQAESNVIRVHPALDREAVPERFVRYIVFHELLHALFPSYKDSAGRWIHHTPEFRAREARYADYAFALRWERDELFKAIR